MHISGKLTSNHVNKTMLPKEYFDVFLGPLGPLVWALYVCDFLPHLVSLLADLLDLVVLFHFATKSFIDRENI